MMLVLFIITAAVISSSNAGKRFAGPFDIVIKEPVRCDDEGTREYYFNDTTVRKKSRILFTISTNAFFSIPFDDETTVTVSFSVWGNGGWRPNYLTLVYNGVCKDMAAVLPAVFQKLLAAANTTGCPIPPGDYRVEDMNASPNVAFPSLPYNRYKISFLFSSKGGTLLGCSGIVAHIVPKENKRG